MTDEKKSYQLREAINLFATEVEKIAKNYGISDRIEEITIKDGTTSFVVDVKQLNKINQAVSRYQKK